MAYQSLANKLQQFGVDLSPQNRQIVQVPDFYYEVPPGSHVAVPSHKTLLGPGITVCTSVTRRLYT